MRVVNCAEQPKCDTAALSVLGRNAESRSQRDGERECESVCDGDCVAECDELRIAERRRVALGGGVGKRPRVGDSLGFCRDCDDERRFKRERARIGDGARIGVPVGLCRDGLGARVGRCYRHGAAASERICGNHRAGRGFGVVVGERIAERFELACSVLFAARDGLGVGRRFAFALRRERNLVKVSWRE